MNKFAQWMEANCKKQRGVAQKLGISTSTLHDILRNGHIPNLKVAYKIEQHTKGNITLYDWVDQYQEENNCVTKSNNKAKIANITK